MHWQDKAWHGNMIINESLNYGVHDIPVVFPLNFIVKTRETIYKNLYKYPIPWDAQPVLRQRQVVYCYNWRTCTFKYNTNTVTTVQ